MKTETVSKTTGGDAAPIEGMEAAKSRKTLTNWRIFEEGGFIPIRIRCEGYLGMHPADLSCHSNLIPGGEAVLRHMHPDHSGGWFKIKFRLSDGKTSPLWRELEEAGVELQHFYCPHCREEVPLTPRGIIKHLQPHAGANRINMDPQTLAMTLSFTRAEVDEYDDLYLTERG